MPAEKLKKMTLPSVMEQVDALDSFIDALQQQLDFNDDMRANIQLALNEAVTNAIVHGNKQQLKKKVIIQAQLSDQVLEISVKDEGSGFNPKELPDPLDDDHLMQQTGRGIFLIKQYTDRLTFSDGASKLHLFFNMGQHSAKQ